MLGCITLLILVVNVSFRFPYSNSNADFDLFFKIQSHIAFKVANFSLILLSLSMVVLNSRDRPGKLWLPDFSHF